MKVPKEFTLETRVPSPRERRWPEDTMHVRYQEWLNHVFDHAVTSRAWYFEEDAPAFVADASDIVDLVVDTFEHAGRDLARFPDAQVDQGLWYLVSAAGSNYLAELQNIDVPLRGRLRAITSILSLYQECFRPRCTEALGHLDEPGASALNSICYMFWDVGPLINFTGAPDRTKLEDAVSGTLEAILEIPHRACRESALHGLGELSHGSPVSVHQVVDRFLATAEIDERLRAYALNAREGHIL